MCVCVCARVYMCIRKCKYMIYMICYLSFTLLRTLKKDRYQKEVLFITRILVLTSIRRSYYDNERIKKEYD